MSKHTVQGKRLARHGNQIPTDTRGLIGQSNGYAAQIYSLSRESTGSLIIEIDLVSDGIINVWLRRWCDVVTSARSWQVPTLASVEPKNIQYV